MKAIEYVNKRREELTSLIAQGNIEKANEIATEIYIDLYDEFVGKWNTRKYNPLTLFQEYESKGNKIHKEIKKLLPGTLGIHEGNPFSKILFSLEPELKDLLEDAKKQQYTKEIF